MSVVAAVHGELPSRRYTQDEVTEALLPDDALELTWRSLAEVGNISSASVLHVLRDTITKRPPAGSPGVLMAMGPGFCSELVLLRWR